MLAACLAGLALIRGLHAATRVSQPPQPDLPEAGEKVIEPNYGAATNLPHP